ncbi:hypothetical protein ACI2JA_03255 [Alkalihalobacillus sp. NPDC078783]
MIIKTKVNSHYFKSERLINIKLHIEKKLYIEKEGMNYTIRNYTGKFDDKDKELYKQIGGYYGKLNEALKALFRHKLDESKPTSIPEVIESIDRIESWLEKVVSGH